MDFPFSSLGTVYLFGVRLYFFFEIFFSAKLPQYRTFLWPERLGVSFPLYEFSMSCGASAHGLDRQGTSWA